MTAEQPVAILPVKLKTTSSVYCFFIQGPPSQHGQVSGQQQQQPGAQPGPYSYAQQPNQPPAPAQAAPGSNPYARQGQGYGAGYPRPTGNYPGYQ